VHGGGKLREGRRFFISENNITGGYWGAGAGMAEVKEVGGGNTRFL